MRVTCPAPRHRLPRVLLGMLLLAASLSLPVTSVPLAAADTVGPQCARSGPEGGAYQVEVCLTATWGDEGQTGDVRVSATVEAVSGTLPEELQLGFGLAKSPSTRSFDVLTDYAAPYELTLPSERFVDGTYRLSAEAEFKDGFDADPPTLTIAVANGVTQEPQAGDTWTPRAGRPGSPFVLAAVGDGAGGLPGADAVGDLITGWDPSLLLYLGDVYKAGTYTEFANYYAPTLGELKDITNPVPGNHEAGAGFEGYFQYWDTFRHNYAVDVAGWHLVGLDTTETYNQTEPGDPQYEWLAEDLDAHADDCTIVFLHHPRWGLKRESDYERFQPIWELLATNGVEVALAGHEHSYQRWQPLDAAGEVVPDGVTQFVVGTGGHELEPFQTSDARVVAGIERRDGAMRLELTDEGAAFQFAAIDGTVLDSGSVPCAVSGAISLSKTKSKTEGRVEAELTNFTPGSKVTVRWDDGTVLGSARADASGSAVVPFRTPSAPYGAHAVTAEDESGVDGAAQLSVIPRVKLTRDTVAAGSDLRVYLHGFAAGQFVEVRLTHEDGTTSEVVGTVTTGPEGNTDVRVAVPAGWRPGPTKVVVRPASGDRRSASASIEITEGAP